MKKFMLTLSALVVTAGLASAQSPPPGCPAGAGTPGPAYDPGPSMGAGGHGGFGFGLFSGLFSNHGHGRRNVQVLPVATTGQLVFPQNPFTRSPRDYFMIDVR